MLGKQIRTISVCLRDTAFGARQASANDRAQASPNLTPCATIQLLTFALQRGFCAEEVSGRAVVSLETQPLPPGAAGMLLPRLWIAHRRKL
jgi:hypothetical protein